MTSRTDVIKERNFMIVLDIRNWRYQWYQGSANPHKHLVKMIIIIFYFVIIVIGPWKITWGSRENLKTWTIGTVIR